MEAVEGEKPHLPILLPPSLVVSSSGPCLRGASPCFEGNWEAAQAEPGLGVGKAPALPSPTLSVSLTPFLPVCDLEKLPLWALSPYL